MKPLYGVLDMLVLRTLVAMIMNPAAGEVD